MKMEQSRTMRGFESRRLWHLLSLLLAVFFSFGADAVESANSTNAMESLRGLTMGAGWSVKYIVPAKAPVKTEVHRALQSLLDRLEGQMSTWRDDTDLARFNAARRTDWFPVPRETVLVVIEAQRISKLTGGAFDVTVESLVRLWGFGPRGRLGVVPSAAAIEEAQAKIGWRHLDARLDLPVLKKAIPALSVDLSALAPGFAADEIGRWLELRGVTNYLAEVGGELRARGHDSRGRPWRVGIERPVDDNREIARVVALDNLSLATSGDYRNFFIKDGRRYAHIVDPRTGRPTEHVAAVSIAHPSAMTADALATALMVLGPEQGMKLAREQGWPVQFVVREGNVLRTTATPQFERLVVESAK